MIKKVFEGCIRCGSPRAIYAYFQQSNESIDIGVSSDEGMIACLEDSKASLEELMSKDKRMWVKLVAPPGKRTMIATGKRVEFSLPRGETLLVYCPSCGLDSMIKFR